MMLSGRFSRILGLSEELPPDWARYPVSVVRCETQKCRFCRGYTHCYCNAAQKMLHCKRGASLDGESDDSSARTSRSDLHMTAFVEHAHELGVAFSPTGAPPTATRTVATIRSRLANFWPPALIGFGLVLTLGWNVGLAWLLYELI